MKGVFWVVMMVGLLVTAYLVVRNLSLPDPSGGDVGRLEAIDHARQAADQMNREAERTEELLRRSTAQ